MGTRMPNEALERLYRETGWTLRQFAQAVNRIGTERRSPLRYREPSVHQWLGGGLPRDPVPALIVEALSRRLGRPITLTEAGFPPARSESNANLGTDTVDGLVDLGRHPMDASRRRILGAGLFSVALTIPGWQDVVGRMEAIKADPHARIGRAEVEAVTAMTDRLSELDDDFGGRYARPMAAAFLANNVAPYLKASASPEIRREMMSAASFLCYLTGWMAVDENLHGLAQQYYVRSLELAGASDDHMTYCHVLRGMSVQAADLGHGGPAVRLADASAEAAPTSTPRMRAFLAGQQAHAYALVGDRSSALNSIRTAERAVEQSESAAGSFGGYTSATLAYHTSQVRYALEDTEGSIDSLHDHFRLRQDNDRQRTELIFGSLLAERQLQVGHLEAACATWSKVLASYPGMHSGRVDRQVANIPALLKPYRSNAAARDVYESVLQMRTST